MCICPSLQSWFLSKFFVVAIRNAKNSSSAQNNTVSPFSFKVFYGKISNKIFLNTFRKKVVQETHEAALYNAMFIRLSNLFHKV